MPKSYGKEWENKIKEDFLKIEGAHLERLYDVTNGYKSIRCRSDFIGYIYPNIFFLEAKSHYGNTFPWSEFRQYEDMLEVVGIKGVRSGVLLWMIDHQSVVYLPVRTISYMKNDGKKSFNIKDLEDPQYRMIKIPAVRKRVFMDCDYSVLTSLNEGD